MRHGRITQVSPLRVEVKGQTADAPAVAMNDFSAAALNDAVLVTNVDGRRYAWRIA